MSVTEPDELSLGVIEGLPLPLTLMVGETERVALTEGVSATDLVAVTVAVVEGVVVTVAATELDAVPVPEMLVEAVTLEVGCSELLGVTDKLAVMEPLIEGLHVEEDVVVGSTDFEAETLGVGGVESEGVTEGVTLPDGVLVPRLLPVCVGEIDEEAVALPDIVGLTLRVEVTLAVVDGVTVGVTDSVGPIELPSVSMTKLWITAAFETVEDIATSTVSSAPEGTTRAKLMLLHRRGVTVPGETDPVCSVPNVVAPVVDAL